MINNIRASTNQEATNCPDKPAYQNAVCAYIFQLNL